MTFDDAIRAGDYDRAAALLSAEPDDASVVSELEQLQVGHWARLHAAARTLGSAGQRIIRLSALARLSGTITDPGDATTWTAGGGTVEGRTNVRHIEPGNFRDDAAFTLTYRGPDATRTHWLQFVWREMECTPAGLTCPPEEDFQSFTATYRWTTDDAARVYHTDSADPDSPYYEARGVADRAPDSTTMLDRPQPELDQVGQVFRAGAEQVTASAHYTTYLVRERRVLYVVETDIEWLHTRANMRPEPRMDQQGRAATALDPAMRSQLLVQYGDFAELPIDGVADEEP